MCQFLWWLSWNSPRQSFLSTFWLGLFGDSALYSAEDKKICSCITRDTGL
jgi:hypothetical protein